MWIHFWSGKKEGNKCCKWQCLLSPFPLTAFRLSTGYQHHVKNLVKICELFSMGQLIIGVFLKGSTSTGLGHFLDYCTPYWLRLMSF